MRRHSLILCLALSSAALTARADVYKIVDAEGHVEYTDRWVPGAERIKSDHLHGTDQPADPDEQKKFAASNEHIAAEQAQQAAAKAVSQDVASTQAQQCKTARENYEKLIQARRVYKPGKDGDREYLSDAEADQQRIQARLDMEQLCGKSATPTQSP